LRRARAGASGIATSSDGRVTTLTNCALRRGTGFRLWRARARRCECERK